MAATMYPRIPSKIEKSFERTRYLDDVFTVGSRYGELLRDEQREKEKEEEEEVSFDRESLVSFPFSKPKLTLLERARDSQYGSDIRDRFDVFDDESDEFRGLEEGGGREGGRSFVCS